MDGALLLELFSDEDVEVVDEVLSTKTGGYCSYSSKYGCLSDWAAVMRCLKSNFNIFWKWIEEID